jgi:hypothetical protein
MKITTPMAIACTVLSLLLTAHVAAQSDRPDCKSRTFDFTYAATVTGLKPGETARVWLPVPPSNSDQQVRQLKQELPGTPQETIEARFANHLLYLEASANADGKSSLSVIYRVTRLEVCEESTPPTQPAVADAEYLKPDALVPIGGKPARLLDGKQIPDDQVHVGRLLYDTVDNHMQYRKDRPGWGRGDAVWACDSRFGNCTDFHSLFISLARTQHIPAEFEIGFPIPTARGGGDVAGYHCWAKFKPQGRGWIPVDISEANKDPTKREYFFGHLCENRVAFSTGRDLILTPRQDGPPVNFLVYPYVEVDGKPLAPEHIEKHIKYADIPNADQRPSGMVTSVTMSCAPVSNARALVTLTAPSNALERR